MVGKLAEWNGWTIDMRLQQFRKVDKEGLLFVNFDTPEGIDVFIAFCDEMDEYHNEISSGYRRQSLDLENNYTHGEELVCIAEDMVSEVTDED